MLLFPAEDSLPIVRARLEGIAAAAQVPFDSLPVQVITAPTLRLDTPPDRARLLDTVQLLRPVLLILDPLIRLHRLDENDATAIAGLLSYLRELQRQFALAVMLVHHARKDSHASRPGQALRGSSELHGWGDSNLYMRRKGAQLTLSTEHRAAPGQDHIPLQLAQSGSALALSVLSDPPPRPPEAGPTPIERVRAALAQLQEPIFSVQQLRKLCSIRTETLCARPGGVDPAGRTEPQRQRLPAQPAVSPFPPYRPPGKRKRETAPLLRRRIGLCRDATRAPTGACTQQTGRTTALHAAVPAPSAGADPMRQIPRGRGGRRPPASPTPWPSTPPQPSFPHLSCAHRHHLPCSRSFFCRHAKLSYSFLHDLLGFFPRAATSAHKILHQHALPRFSFLLWCTHPWNRWGERWRFGP